MAYLCQFLILELAHAELTEAEKIVTRKVTTILNLCNRSSFRKNIRFINS